jgi:hypothetical protein
MRSQFTGSYTWSHSIANVGLDDSSGLDQNSFTDPANPSLNRGNSTINRPHIFAANFTYYLPDLKDKSAVERGVLGGWELSSIVNVASGNSNTLFQNGVGEDTTKTILIPDTANPGKFVHASGGLNNIVGTGFGNNIRPSLTGQSCTEGRSGNQIYNVNTFTLIGNQIGSYSPNLEPNGQCRGASLANWDFSLDKNFKLSERFKLQFRVDFFDFLNHPNFRTDSGAFGNPIGTVNCGAQVPDPNAPAGTMAYQACSPTNNIISAETRSVNWGKSNQTVGNAGREIQYSLHLTF